MQPASIRNLIAEAEELLTQSLNNNKYAVPAFLTSWVAWEAMRTRLIRVIMHHKGYKIKDADYLLAKSKVASMREAESVIVKLGICSPHHWPGKSGKHWKMLTSIEPLRHRLIHGFKTVEPARINVATRLVIFLVINHEWLSEVPIVDAARKKDRILVGSLLTPRRTGKKTHSAKIDELAVNIGVNLDQGTRRLPSLANLEEAAKRLSV